MPRTKTSPVDTTTPHATTEPVAAYQHTADLDFAAREAAHKITTVINILHAYTDGHGDEQGYDIAIAVDVLADIQSDLRGSIEAAKAARKAVQ